MNVSGLTAPSALSGDNVICIEPPMTDDGVECWRIARDSKVLDVNSKYAYLLWCRDFAETSVVARCHDGPIVGFITGYRRPEEPETLLVWQVAVAPVARGQGLAGRMLDTLFDQVDGAEYVETTITPDNEASIALFRAFAKRRGARVQTDELFGAELLGSGHKPENKYRIGPIPANAGQILRSSASVTMTKRHTAPADSAKIDLVDDPLDTFAKLESEVRSYCRSWPVVFDTAVGSQLTDIQGRSYLDFFSGAGALNYGHNNPKLKGALLDYLARDGIVHALDMHTAAKAEFLQTFSELVLKPRGLNYRVQFPGPTGTNAVESALKLARKVTGKEAMINFTNAFHGMTLGSLSVTGNSMKRGGAGVPLVHATPMPYDNYFDGQVPDFLWFERALEDAGSSLNEPAAVIVETVQGEGGINPARAEWLRGLADLCHKHEILLIVDDVQMGCGRTGPFFSFEIAGIQPDIVCISKSISGYGLPMALTLLKPELDVWAPGEHNGTFRGNNPAFVTATAALREYWTDDALEKSTLAKGEMVDTSLRELVDSLPGAELEVKGRGLARGLGFGEAELADRAAAAAFERGLLLETSGPECEVAKIMPALTISDQELVEGLEIFADAVRSVV